MSNHLALKHLFFLEARGSREDFARMVWGSAVPALRSLTRGPLKIGLTEHENPRRTVLPLRRENLLMVSAWGEVDAAAIAAALRPLGDEVFGYRVDESYPVRYTRAWPDGERSPGDVLLTLLVKNAQLTDEEFMHEWHGRHTPKAMRIHPMWSYARNVVMQAVVPGSPLFEGVVEEHYRELRDITNPLRMFGGTLRALPNMLEVARHAKHFLDLRRTKNYLIAEYHLVSGEP